MRLKSNYHNLKIFKNHSIFNSVYHVVLPEVAIM